MTSREGMELGVVERETGKREEPLWVHRFDIAGVAGAIPEARRRISAAAASLGLEGTALFELLFAVGEALTNAVKHGSPRGELDRVYVAVGVCSGGVAVQISDQGQGFADTPACHPDAMASTGRGIPFMRSLSDEFRFDCAEGGTRVLLVKLLDE